MERDIGVIAAPCLGLMGVRYCNTTKRGSETAISSLKSLLPSPQLRTKADHSGKRLGRPRVSAEVEQRILDLWAQGTGINRIAQEVGCGNATVQRVLGV